MEKLGIEPQRRENSVNGPRDIDGFTFSVYTENTNKRDTKRKDPREVLELPLGIASKM